MDLHSKRSVTIFIFFTMAVLSLAQWTNAEGCATEELGVRVPSPKRIPDKYMTSSSYESSGYQAFRGRIGLQTTGSWGDAWCASDSDANPYIQVFFEFLTNIVMIVSEGVVRDGEEMWVKSYEVSTSNDSKSWTTYSVGNIMQLQANTAVQAKNVTLNDVWAHFIRIHPKSRNGKWRCMRIALFGCQTGTDGPTMYLDDDLINDSPYVKTPLKETLFLVIPIVIFGCLIIAGLVCLCRRHKPRKARQIQEKREKREKEEKYNAEAKLGIDHGVIYENPPPYEFQTVALDFDHDNGGHDNEDGGKDIQPGDTPVFNDGNKIFSFERNSVHFS